MPGPSALTSPLSRRAAMRGAAQRGAARQRAAQQVAALLALALALLAALAPLPALAAPPSSAQVIDEAHALPDPGALAQRLRGIEFREPVALVALTLDAREHVADPTDERALNDAVLAYARAAHPEWIRGEKWADGLVIIALDPKNRKLGTYAGDDVALDDGGFSGVQDAMRDSAKDGAWEDALVDGAQEYAALLGRPWWRHPAALIGGALAVGLAALKVGGAVLTRARTRRRVDHALERLEDVRARHLETEAAARRLPTGSAYGESIRADVADYRASVTAAEDLAAQLPERRGLLWGMDDAEVKLSRRLESKVRSADTADDTIIAAADLLGRSGRWREAWAAERRPLDASLAAVAETVEKSSRTSPAAAEHLRAEAELVRGELEETSRAFEQRRIEPDAALEQLDRLTERLSFAAHGVREEWIAGEAKGAKEQRVMRKALPQGFTSDFETTVRARRFAREPQAYASDYSISPVLWTLLWMPSATSALEDHRSPASSSGSGSVGGYSGGSFSGAGSSSSF